VDEKKKKIAQQLGKKLMCARGGEKRKMCSKKKAERKRSQKLNDHKDRQDGGTKGKKETPLKLSPERSAKVKEQHEYDGGANWCRKEEWFPRNKGPRRDDMKGETVEGVK